MLRLTQNMLIIKNGLKVHTNVKERRARFNAILKEISHLPVVNGKINRCSIKEMRDKKINEMVMSVLVCKIYIGLNIWLESSIEY